jgi:hypothetical protein
MFLVEAGRDAQLNSQETSLSSQALEVRDQVGDLRRRELARVAVFVSAAARCEPLGQCLRTAVVHERRTERHRAQRWHLQHQTRADVCALVIAESFTRVAAGAAHSFGLEQRLTALYRYKV